MMPVGRRVLSRGRGSGGVAIVVVVSMHCRHDSFLAQTAELAAKAVVHCPTIRIALCGVATVALYASKGNAVSGEGHEGPRNSYQMRRCGV